MLSKEEKAMVSETRNMLEGLVREGSFKWWIGNRYSLVEEVEEMGKPGCGHNCWIPELSPGANIVVRKCSRILSVPISDLQEEFDTSASHSLRDASHYARNLLEFFCFRALAFYTHLTGHLADKKFCRLTFEMMLAWEAPSPTTQTLPTVNEDATVGKESFSRIAPGVPIIADVITASNLFEVLTTSSGGRLQYPTYEKYIIVLGRALKKLKTRSESSLLSALRLEKREKVLEIDGTVTTRPVLQHVGKSIWPGRLTLTDHALYFQPLRVVSYDQPQRYDLEEDLKQVVKPELTGPWGTRLFDKAVLYKSISLSEPVVMDFPERKGHTRRDYWLAIIQEILFVHRFIYKFKLIGTERDEALLKAILGILRLQAVRVINAVGPLRYDSLLIFSFCDNLPGGDLILDTLANMSLMPTSRVSKWTNSSQVGTGISTISTLVMAYSAGFGFGSNSTQNGNHGLLVGKIAVGDMTPLEKVVKESKTNYEKVVLAQETVDGFKADGIGINLTIMKELLYPLIEIWKSLQCVFLWEDPLKSIAFCLIFGHIIIRGWICRLLALLLILVAVFIIISRFGTRDRHIDELKVIASPPKKKMERLLALQNAVSQVEELIQDGNIVLLKIRTLILSIVPQASNRCVFVLLLLALILALMPLNYTLLLWFLEAFTRHSPPRNAAAERFKRRMKEWWSSIPAASVTIEREKGKKRKYRM